MDKKTRICIVGGGPAGLSAGMYLEKKGYENYTILERLDRVGGKCWSPTYNGRRYEMGAIMGVPSYYAVHDVEEFCGITHDGPVFSNESFDMNIGVTFPFVLYYCLKLIFILKRPSLQSAEMLPPRSSVNCSRQSTTDMTSTVTAESLRAVTRDTHAHLSVSL